MRKFKLSLLFASVALAASGEAFAALNADGTGGTNSIAFGSGASASGSGAIALGPTASGQSGAQATGGTSIAIGTASVADASNALAIGKRAESHSQNGFAIGAIAVSHGQNALAMGMSSLTYGQDSITLGTGARVGGQTIPAQGEEGQEGYVPESVSSFNNSVAIGQEASVDANYGFALGSKASISTDAAYGLALGSNTTVTAHGGTAIGFNSVADRLSQSNDPEILPGYLSEGQGGKAWRSGGGAVSFGNSTTTRQLINVAAGSEDTDAVNVAQLRALHKISQENTVIGLNASSLISDAVPDDPNTEDVNEAKDAETATNAVIIGNNGSVKVNNGSAFGYNAQVMADAPEGSVAIGANSVATLAGRNEQAPQFNYSEATGDAWKSEGLVSFGYTTTSTEGEGEAEKTTSVQHNRILTGVAAGSEDNDAVNVAQLKEVDKQVQGLVQGSTKISQIDLLADPDNPTSGGIGLRFMAAPQSGGSTEEVAPQAAGDEIGRLVYTDTDPEKTVRRVATLDDGITISVGSSSSAARDGAESVKVDLKNGISFLTDSKYLSADVAADGNGGAIVTFKTTQDLDNAIANAGGNTGGTTGGDSGNSGSTGGSGWTPNATQQAALNGTYANGLTAGEGDNAVSIAREKDVDGRYIVDMGGNRIQNVGAPQAATDAANKQYVDSTARSLRSKINDVDKDLRAGVAMAMAVGGLPQAYMPGKSIVGVSAGTYHGQGGFALGLSHATDNRQWVFKGAASVDTRGNFGGQLSAGYQF